MLKAILIILLIVAAIYLLYRFLGLHEPSEYPEKLKPQETEYDFFKDTNCKQTKNKKP